MLFFFNDTATTEIYTLSLHDALPIYRGPLLRQRHRHAEGWHPRGRLRGGGHQDAQRRAARLQDAQGRRARRSEEHTSELQSRQYLVCRLLLEKKKDHTTTQRSVTTL